MDTVPVIGGTGALGFAVALRLAQAAVPVVIGSRDAGRAEEAAAKIRERVQGAAAAGAENGDAAAQGPIVLLCVPFRAQSENLTNLKQALDAGADSGGRHGAAGGGGVRQGHAPARSAPGLRRPSRPRRWCRRA